MDVVGGIYLQPTVVMTFHKLQNFVFEKLGCVAATWYNGVKGCM
jgi:hypothetical protein